VIKWKNLPPSQILFPPTTTARFCSITNRKATISMCFYETLFVPLSHPMTLTEYFQSKLRLQLIRGARAARLSYRLHDETVHA
jgi:hypothetical protein